MLALSALFLHPATAAVDAPFVQGGKAGFVVSKISYALGPDAKDADTCPGGNFSAYAGSQTSSG
ncbi:hypothetical protein GCM10027217_22940 [Pseudomaricurvus hydrocarbonicus]